MRDICSAPSVGARRPLRVLLRKSGVQPDFEVAENDPSQGNGLDQLLQGLKPNIDLIGFIGTRPDPEGSRVPRPCPDTKHLRIGA